MVHLPTKGGWIEELEIHLETSLLEHLADDGSLDHQILGGDQGERQSVWISCLTEELTRFVGIKGIRTQVGIIAEPIDWNEGRDDDSIPFRSIPDQILAIDGEIDGLSQAYIAPWAAFFQHVDHAKHGGEAPTTFHDFGHGTLSHLKRVQ